MLHVTRHSLCEPSSGRLVRAPRLAANEVTEVTTKFDTIVIGSGPGGLTAALALARSGRKVLVLEQHYLPGGWTHSFTLDGFRFSPGVHYIGNLEPGGGLRRVYESFGLTNDLEFCEMNPEGFDHFLVGGERFDQPRGLDRWKARLAARFPHEAAGIDRYFATLAGVVDDLNRVESELGFPEVLALPFRAPRLVRWGFRRLDALLDAHITDPTLRGVLAAQCGNHGLAPSRVSLPLHAAMTAHYFGGAFYPRGGAKRIPAAYLKALRKLGGAIRLKSPVTRIVVEDGRAVGVEVAGEEILRADTIVCNADPAVVYGRLLDAKYCASEHRKAEKAAYSVSTMSLFCGVAMDLRARGYDSGNYWLYRSNDVGGIYGRMERELPRGELEALFLSITSLKDPGHTPPGTHAIEMFTFVPYEAFAAWESSAQGSRSPAYEELKQSLAAKMLSAAEEIIPGIRKNLVFTSVGSPLTNDFYCRSHRGSAYGTAKTPLQIGPFSFRARGPVEGLFMCGASILSHGIAGATISGLVAAQEALGLGSYEELLGAGDGSLRVLASETGLRVGGGVGAPRSRRGAAGDEAELAPASVG